MRQLIINADDFGLHEAINQGIIESHTAGCVTSTTIMAGGRAFEHAADLAKQHPKLGVGVHLTLVGAAPVARADINTLLNREGVFYENYGQFAQRYFTGRIAKEHIAYEFRCQMQKVARHGIRITHVDSHQHLHALPGMAGIVSEVAREFNVRKVRIPAEPLGFLGAGSFRAGRFAARALLTGCAALARQNYKKQGLYGPRYFYGMLAGGAMSEAELLNIITNLPEGTAEIMVHPGKSTADLAQAFAWGYRWQQEMEALQSKAVLDALHAGNIELINYRELTQQD